MASLGSGDNNRQSRKPRHRPNVRRRLFAHNQNIKRRLSQKGDALLTFSQELFRSYVWFASAQASGHMDRGLPGQSVHGGSSVVSDLERWLTKGVGESLQDELP